MQTKILAIAAAALLAGACMDVGEPYNIATQLYTLSVQVVYPEGATPQEGAEVNIQDINGDMDYSVYTDGNAFASLLVPNGLFRIMVRDRDKENIYNATADKVLVNGADVSLSMTLKGAKAGAFVLKEIYCGGCSKAPLSGTWQSDQYVIIHNNAPEVQYLDGLCFGVLAPSNATATNYWLLDSGDLREDFVPIYQAILMFPGSGTDFPLQPGEDAVLVLCGAIDHTQQYPLSVNLNNPDYFVCYSPDFPNTLYHPTPGDLIRQDHYMEIVVKTGIANAYTMSINSPAVVLFRPVGTDIHTYAKDPLHQPQRKSETVVSIPPEWIIDAVEVFNGMSSGNKKRLIDVLDSGYITLSDTHQGYSLMRKADDDATQKNGYQYLQDSNNSTLDFYERSTQSLHQ